MQSSDSSARTSAATRPLSGFILVVIVAGLAYHAVLLFTPLLAPYRFPVPYAVPIFDTPFALVALGVAYLCLERHRLRQDSQSAALGVTLGLTGLLAITHVFAQPDYPGAAGVDPGITPYFFFLSYLGGLAGIGVATRLGDRPLPMSDRQRLASVVGVVIVSALLVVLVLKLRPLLPDLATTSGRMTPSTIWAAGISNGIVGTWALLGARRRMLLRRQDRFGGLLLLAGCIWMLGLAGFLIFPERHAVSWYVAGFARPIGVGLIFVALLREQVWLYREARGRVRDLEGLHEAGQALVRSLDPRQIGETITTQALTVAGGDAAILFRLDAQAGVLRPFARSGERADDLAAMSELPVGLGAAGLAVAEQRPVSLPDIHADARIQLPRDLRDRLDRVGMGAVLAVPLLVKSGEVFGALSVFFRASREFSGTDLERLSAFGTQASVALENARSFEELAVRARHDAALQAFGQRLLEASTDAVILDDAVAVTSAVVGAPLVAVFRLEPGTGQLRMVAGAGWIDGIVGETVLPPSTRSLAGYVFVQKAPIAVEDLAAEQRSSPEYVTAHGVRAGIGVPLGVHDRPIGGLLVYYREPHVATDEEQRVLASVAHQAALALEKVRLNVELQANLERLRETQAQLIQADKLTALSTLLSGVAHELNNPLSTIQLSVQLMKRAELPDRVQKRLEAIEEECERASRVIRDLLVFARRRPPDRRPVDVNRIVKGVVSLQTPELELARIRIVADLAPLPLVMADGHQLQQVFLNLFMNARHAIKSGSGQGTLSVRSALRGGQVVVEVEDDGPGIPPENLGRIFDPFFTTKAAGEGSGLGLSLSIGIVEAHGGTIRVENLPTSGVRFTVHLPLGDAEPAAPPAPRPGQRRRARVLVVDDELPLRATLTEVFTSLGHEVEAVGTGAEALARLRNGSFDFVSLDLRLSDIDGKTVWQELLARNPEIADRVVFMTGDTMSADAQKFLEETGRPVLMKPLSIERIGQVVDEVLAGHAPPAA